MIIIIIIISFISISLPPFFIFKSKDLMYNVIIYYEERKILKSDLVYENKIDK